MLRNFPYMSDDDYVNETQSCFRYARFVPHFKQLVTDWKREEASDEDEEETQTPPP